jgi:Derlin-2/3
MALLLLLLCLQARFCSSRINLFSQSILGRGRVYNDEKISLFQRIEQQTNKQCNDHNDDKTIDYTNRIICQIRAGKKNEAKEEKEEEVEEEEEAEDDFDEEESPASKGQADVVTSYIKDIWVKTPPISQIYLGSTLGLAIACFVLNKNQWPEYLNLEWKPFLTRFQLWRPITAFMYFGPIGLNYILTMQFVWTYFAQLEKLHYNRPEEFLLMILFGCVTLIGSYSLLGLSTKFLGHNLSTYLVYIWSKLFEGTEVSVMDLFLLKAELLPWFFVAQTFLLEGEMPYADMLGIVVGHLYHYLAKIKILVAPPFLKDLFSSPKIQAKYARFKGEFE